MEMENEHIMMEAFTDELAKQAGAISSLINKASKAIGLSGAQARRLRGGVARKIKETRKVLKEEGKHYGASSDYSKGMFRRVDTGKVVPRTQWINTVPSDKSGLKFNVADRGKGLQDARLYK